jgi:hypothetical protein
MRSKKSDVVAAPVSILGDRSKNDSSLAGGAGDSAIARAVSISRDP